jgi:uncharacterized membrane protein (UPF0127 family)
MLFALSKVHVTVWFLCSDREAGYSQRHHPHVLDCHAYLIDFHFDTMVKYLQEKRNLPVLDMLHIEQKMRVKIVHPDIA